MTLRVELTRRAERDIDEISPGLQGCHRREPVPGHTDSNRSSLTYFSSSLLACTGRRLRGDTEIRQLVFKTRRGKPYRILLTIRDDVVFVRHVRGPGQDLVPPSELIAPNG